MLRLRKTIMLAAIAYLGSLADDHGASRQPTLLGALLRFGASLRPNPNAAADDVAGGIIEANGGRMTDAVEREIGVRLLNQR